MKRKHKTYSKPKRPFDKQRIDEEAEIKKEFGLKNKKEIWKAEARIKSIREKGKKLILADAEEQQILFDKLKKIGLNVNSIGDILSLDKKNYLQRRLQTILVNKKIARTPKEARQLITHKKVLVNRNVVNSPSYIVPVEFENQISLKETKIKKEKPVEKKEEKVEEVKKSEEEIKKGVEKNEEKIEEKNSEKAEEDVKKSIDEKAEDKKEEIKLEEQKNEKGN